MEVKNTKRCNNCKFCNTRKDQQNNIQSYCVRFPEWKLLRQIGNIFDTFVDIINIHYCYEWEDEDDNSEKIK